MDNFLFFLYQWYNENRRDLPWRKTTDPYKIWVSEIILQQTRISQGIGYYQRFVERFPALVDLAGAEEDEVLRLWQGLGYYSRARNLHASAKYICEIHKGEFPRSFDEILQLKGVGSYTAAAIASIAFNLPCPALDGNVLRVVSRYFGIFTPVDSAKGKKHFLKIAVEIMPEKDPGLHNQALMEFGALQCTPFSPRCSDCPVWLTCFAARNDKVDELPVKTKTVQQRPRFFNYYFVESEDGIWLEKRTGKDIWKNLYQFPLVETTGQWTENEIAGSLPDFLKGCQVNVKSISAVQRHILSHQIIFARIIHIEASRDCRLNGHYFKVPPEALSDFPIPRLIEKLMGILE